MKKERPLSKTAIALLAHLADEGQPSDRCKQCGGQAEEERRSWATVLCFACVPPPRGLLLDPIDWWDFTTPDRGPH